MEVAADSQPVVEMTNNDVNDARDKTAVADTRTPKNEAPPIADLEDATFFFNTLHTYYQYSLTHKKIGRKASKGKVQEVQ